jgi:hypothetical protein
LGYLSQMVAEYSDTLTEDINEDLFDRRLGKQVYQFIIDDLKSIEMLPGIHLSHVEYITDPSKLDVRLNRKNIKSKKILKQKLEKLIPIQLTAFDALKFRINIQGFEDKETGLNYVENLILIPKYIDRYHFLVNGNKTLVMFQVVDNAIYNQKGDIILKTRIPGKLSKEKRKKVVLTDITTLVEYKIDIMMIDLFKKKFTPLFYYIAKKGVLETIEYFGYTRFMDIVVEPRNPELFHYFKINSNIMVEVEKELFTADSFFRTFVAMFTTVFNTRNRIEDIYDDDNWTKRLGSLFTSSTKNQPNKGLDVLKSFKNVLDATTQRILRIDDRDKGDIYAVVRWMMREFNNLRNADNNDLQNRRIRSNEYIAAYFGLILKDKVNYALNLKPYDPMKLGRVFKFDEYVLFKSLFGGLKACPLFRYNMDINDLQALNGLKYSVTGIQGLPSARIKDDQRDLYPSHLGRFELNAISPSSPGVSGMLTPFCKIYGEGYFGDASNAAKSQYEGKFRKRVKEIKSDEVRYASLKLHQKAAQAEHARRRWIYKHSDMRNERGFIRIVRPIHIRSIRGFISIATRLRYIPYGRNERGFIKLTRKNNNRPRIIRKLRPIRVFLK